MDLVPAVVVNVAQKKLGDALAVPHLRTQQWRRSFSSFDEVKHDLEPDWRNLVRLMKIIRDQHFTSISSYVIQHFVRKRANAVKKETPSFEDLKAVLTRLAEDKPVYDPFFKENRRDDNAKDRQKVRAYLNNLASCFDPENEIAKLFPQKQ
eukprot:TRINITY_DN349_c0_g1_i1.p4 TRINITY_DN349_c0_g1~~TRINITY_DN349_c0_g1_i1.p4  ORF type:complete len:151 (-),score=28.75 TRINITY_DN349_c0_g1_i1:254-706(-)